MNLIRANLYEVGLGNEHGAAHDFLYRVVTTTNDPARLYELARAALRNRVGERGLYGYDRLGHVKSLGSIYIDPALDTHDGR